MNKYSKYEHFHWFRYPVRYVHHKVVTKANLWQNYAPKISIFLIYSNTVTRHKKHHVTKLVDGLEAGNLAKVQKRPPTIRPWIRQHPSRKNMTSAWGFAEKKLFYTKMVRKLADLMVFCRTFVLIYRKRKEEVGMRLQLSNPCCCRSLHPPRLLNIFLMHIMYSCRRLPTVLDWYHEKILHSGKLKLW